MQSQKVQEQNLGACHQTPKVVWVYAHAYLHTITPIFIKNSHCSPFEKFLG